MFLAARGRRRKMLAQAAAFAKQGFRYMKLKIAPGMEFSFAHRLRLTYPDFPLMTDANAAYPFDEASIALFGKMDDLNFLCHEQPLAWDDLFDHAQLQSRI